MQLKVDGLLYFFETRIVGGGVGHCIHLDGFFSRKIAGRLQSINAMSINEPPPESFLFNLH